MTDYDFGSIDHNIEVEFMGLDEDGVEALRDYLQGQANFITEFIGTHKMDREDLENRLQQLDELGE